MRIVLLSLAVAVCAGRVEGALISESVGAGPKTSTIVVDFGLRSYAFEVHYADNLTGLGALQLLDAQSSFRLETTHYSFGDLVSGMEYAGDCKAGTGAHVDDWWKYWTSADGESWSMSGVGVGARQLSDGAWDGWTWVADQGTGQPQVPMPEPTLGLTALVGVVLLRRRRAP